MDRVRASGPWLSFALLAAACSSSAPAGDGFGPGSGSSDEVGSEAGSSSSDTSTSEGSTSGPIFDVGRDTEGSGDCTPVDDTDRVLPCRDQAPPDSFEPDIQWDWMGPDGEQESGVMPLVINLTDDNDDGAIDLCDTPDIIVTVFEFAPIYDGGYGAHLYVLDGETGAVHFEIDTIVQYDTTPAVGDIDGDGLPEIVTSTNNKIIDNQGVQPRLVAFDHEGQVEWMGDDWPESSYGDAIALADLDADGSVEIVAEDFVADASGNILWQTPFNDAYWDAPVPADLDGDGVMEIVHGNAAFSADGSVYYTAPGLEPGFAQVADFDGDLDPEILVTNADGLTLLDHHGGVLYTGLRPTGDIGNQFTWTRPGTVHDFDGDGAAEYAVSSANHYTAFEADASIMWSADVADLSGTAAGTAFDFLGDGTAEAMYADELTMFIFDDTGTALLQIPRTSGTWLEYPIVSDVDNDGSAEIVVVSNDVSDTYMVPQSPTVQVIRDVQDRWIQARRIWNQHTYHITNVREDGTIPSPEVPSWTQLNTFRTNAQIEGGGVCDPEG